MDSYFVQKRQFEVKYLNDGFVSYKHTAFRFTRRQLMHWSHVDYLRIIVMFLITF